MATPGTIVSRMSRPGAIKSVSGIALKRTKIYAREIYKIPIASFTMSKLKDAARKHLKINKASLLPMGKRLQNFKTFESKHFAKPDAFRVSYKKEMKKGTKAYTEFEKYALTDYGSLMIKKVINSKQKFTVYITNLGQAMAQDSHILLPSNYPKIKAYPFSGQLIDPQATIHHEFEHTKYGVKNHAIGSLIEEVAAVIEHENPARILDGYEPRYVYYQRATNKTVSVFNHKNTKSGGRTFDKNDPRILK